jgi:hypothetical protein
MLSKSKRARSRYSNKENLKKIKTSLMSFKDYIKQRNIPFEFLQNSDDKCLVSKDDIIFINNTIIELEKNTIDYGATSIIYKATNNKNKISYILKIMSVSDNEINFMKMTSKCVLKGLTPHFIILHQNLLCSGSEDMIDSTRFLIDNNYSILIMEMFDGNVEYLLNDDYYDDDILISIHAQIYIAILSFHSILKAVHNDSQYKNFYYKKIQYNDNDYFHYIIDGKSIYIKNKGYLIVIADYGFSYNNFLKHRKTPEKQLLDDYDIILDRDDIYKINEYINIDNFDNENIFFKYLIDNTIYFKTDKNIPENHEIINNKPYIIK